MSNIKLIWDFHGPEAKGTAQHHAIHLREFAQREQLSTDECGDEALGPEHHLAWMIVTQAEMPIVRDALRPHRGVLAE